MAPLGKKELLAWAADTTGITPCDKYADLRDGVILLALAARLFPADVDPRVLRRGPTNVERNWAALRRVMKQYGLPLHLCDHNALAAGRARHCFNMLVLFYFLTRLANDSDFCVDFANPIDTGIAAFLQSPESLRCVGRLPAVETAGAKNFREEKCGQSIDKLIQPLPPPPPPLRQQEHQHESLPLSSSRQVLSSSFADMVPPAVPPSSASSVLHRTSLMASLSETCGDIEDHTARSDGGADDVLSKELRAMRAHNTRLEEELHHVRTASQLTLAQQRVLLTSEVARMTEQFEVQMALLRLERDHEVRRCLLDVREEYDNFLGDFTCGASSSSLSPQLSFTAFKALEGKVNVYERELAEARDTIQGLRNAMHVQRDRHEAFAEKISSICAAAPPGGLGEDDFLNVIFPLFETQPQAVRDAVILQLKTLLAQMISLQKKAEFSLGEVTCNGGNADVQAGEDLHHLRMQVERLKRANSFLRNQRCQQEKAHHHRDWYAVPLTDGLEAPSCMIDFETCEAICERASAVAEVHTTAGSSQREDLQRLILVVRILQDRVQTAAEALIAYQAKQQSLYEQLLSARQGEQPDAHDCRRVLEATLDEQSLQLEKKEAVLTTRMRLLEERCSQREAAAKMLHDRVRDMVGMLLGPMNAFEKKGSVAPEEVHGALRQLLLEMEGSQRTRDSMDAALCELSEEVAALRQSVVRRDKEAEQLRAALKAAEAALREERAKSTKAAAELSTLRNVMTVELDASSRYMKRVGELLLFEKGARPLLPSQDFLLTRTEPESANADFPAAAKPSAPAGVNTSSHSSKTTSENESTGGVAAEASLSFLLPAAGRSRESASLLLSSEELERRKVAILEKYGFSNRLSH